MCVKFNVSTTNILRGIDLNVAKRTNMTIKLRIPKILSKIFVFICTVQIDTCA